MSGTQPSEGAFFRRARKAGIANARKLVEKADDQEVLRIVHDWRLFARPDQIAPPGDWQYWLNLGGRGAGKTRTGAEWVRDQVKHGCKRIALVAPTAADTRDVMVEGESGILNVCWSGDRDVQGQPMGGPRYEPSNRRVVWDNGARAYLYSAEEPERLRGPQHDAAWADELCAWRYQQQTWDMLMFGLRLGNHPQAAITTTPKPQKLLLDLMEDPATVIARASTYANRANLAASFFSTIIRKYEGTRLGRQELNAEILTDIEGALWQRTNIDLYRMGAQPDVDRVGVGVDPAATKHGDEHGIVVAGTGAGRRGYVLDDLSARGSPGVWGERAVRAYDKWQADFIVVEVNNGGDMAIEVVTSAAERLYRNGERDTPDVNVRRVHASKGKVTRAEPISALYEQGRVTHVGTFAELEDQLCMITPDFDRNEAGWSPDRMDALVWVLTDLMSGREPATPQIRSL